MNPTPQVARAVVGGVVGTIAMSFALYGIAPWLLGHPMDVAALLATLFHTPRTIGMILHILLGAVVFPLVYLGAVRPFLTGRPAARGVVFGGALWLIAEAIVVPAGGAGFFHIGQGGFAAVFVSLIGHLGYGALLGGIAGPWEPVQEVVGTSVPREQPERRSDAAPADRRGPTRERTGAGDATSGKDVRR